LNVVESAQSNSKA